MAYEYQKYCNPSGNINITTTEATDVTEYATAQVVDADLVASNIKKDINILGVVGTYEGIIPSGNKELEQQTGTDVTYYATASAKSGSATTPATTQQQSTPTFTQSGNVVTANVAATSVSVTPDIEEGWVAEGTAGTVTMSANSAEYTIPAGSATTPATTKQQSAPSISVSSAGLITASVAATSVSVIPTVSAGYVSSGTAGTVTMSANSNTSQLSTQAATTITPTTSAQTAVAAGKYTTGAVTVAAIQTETKTATANGTVTPTSGKYLTSVTVAIPVYDGSVS